MVYWPSIASRTSFLAMYIERPWQISASVRWGAQTEKGVLEILDWNAPAKRRPFSRKALHAIATCHHKKRLMMRLQMMPSQMYLMDEFLFSFGCESYYSKHRSLSSYNHNHRTIILLLLLFIKLFYDLQYSVGSRFQLNGIGAIFGNRFVQCSFNLATSIWYSLKSGGDGPDSREHLERSRNEFSGRVLWKSSLEEFPKAFPEEFREPILSDPPKNLNRSTKLYVNILCMNSVDNKIIIIKSLHPMKRFTRVTQALAMI